MKQLEKCSGRGFDSPHLHQSDIMDNGTRVDNSLIPQPEVVSL